MNFDAAFDKLIGHEGGYVNDPKSEGVKYANEQKSKSHSRIRGGHIRGAGGSGSCLREKGFFNIRSTNQLTKVRLQGVGLRSPCVCKRLVQRPLHQGQEGASIGRAGSRQKARGRVRRMWKADRCERWMGVVSAALQTGSIRGLEGCGYFCTWGQVRPLWRVISQSSVRFSPPWRQGRLSKRDAPKPINANAGKGVGKVQPTVRELSQIGAPR